MTSQTTARKTISSATADGLCSFIDASPSPFHVCLTVVTALEAVGYSELRESDNWTTANGKFFTLRGGSIIAWDATDSAVSAGFKIIGGHTDSPNLRLKQHAALVGSGNRLVGLEPYGGAWLHSWFDRDLGISGRISYRHGNMLKHKLIHLNEPILRVPQLAIHLAEDRAAVTVNPQMHLDALLGAGEAGPSIFGLIAEAAEISHKEILGWELMAHEVTPSAIVGAAKDLVSAPRLDNQVTCYAGLRAFLDASGAGVRVLALFDHEEVGSNSERGAASNFLSNVLERITLASGLSRAEHLATLAQSHCASGDMAHATHPNYSQRHEPNHLITLGGGPVLKVNQNLRYASDAEGAARFAFACAEAEVPLQRYVHRADLPCGSTIGPLTATRTGISTVDVGAPQLAMHSVRETMAVADVSLYARALESYLSLK